MRFTPTWVQRRLEGADRYWLFLDYDGTLADFAPTPDDIIVDRELISLLSELAALADVRVAVISGRRLGHIQQLLPVPGITLAGTYGIELQTPDGKLVRRLRLEQIRPTLERIKETWDAVLKGKPGFYLEEKNWALAIHAKFAETSLAEKTIAAARNAWQELIVDSDIRLLGGDKFLEAAPKLADKGRTVEYLAAEFPVPDALMISMGDDDKDERAFEAVKGMGGIAIRISPQERPTHANFRLQNPDAAREWLGELLRMAEKHPEISDD